MKRKQHIYKAIVAIAVALAFITPVAAVANVGTIGITPNNENTVDIENIVEISTNSDTSDNSNIIESSGTTGTTWWYVDDDNTGGPWDGTPEHPFQYIQDGVDAASDGDTVFVFDGLYYGRYVRVRYDTIDLIGESRENTIIDRGGGSYAVRIYDGAPNSNVSGFTIRNAKKCVEFNDAIDSTVMNCNIYDAVGTTYGYCVEFGSSPGCSVINCNIYNSTYYGIGAFGSGGGGISFNVVNCNIYNNAVGIWAWYTPDSTIKDCNIYNNYERGVYLDLYNSPNCKLSGNSIYNNEYNFCILSDSIDNYHQDISPSNTINGKPMYYLVGQSDITLDETKNIGYLGLISCTNVTVKNSDTFGVLLVDTINSTILNVTSHNSMQGIFLTPLKSQTFGNRYFQ